MMPSTSNPHYLPPNPTPSYPHHHPTHLNPNSTPSNNTNTSYTSIGAPTYPHPSPQARTQGQGQGQGQPLSTQYGPRTGIFQPGPGSSSTGGSNPLHLTSPVQSRVRRQPSNPGGGVSGGPGYPSLPPGPTSTSYHPLGSETGLISPSHPDPRQGPHLDRHPSSSHMISPPLALTNQTTTPTHMSNGSNRSYSYAQGGSGSLHPSTASTSTNPINHSVGTPGAQAPGQPPAFMPGTGNDPFPYPFSLPSFASGEPSTSSSVDLSGSRVAEGQQVNGQTSTSSGRIQGYTGSSVVGYGPGHTSGSQGVNGNIDGLPLNGTGSAPMSAVASTGQSSKNVPGVPVQPVSTSNTAPPAASSSTPSKAQPTNPDPTGHKRRKQHVSRGGSVASLASATSTGSRGSGNPTENVPRVGGVRCYWAMLKPRYPLSECEVPQVNSGSTPSSTSSPHNVGAHAPTRPFPSLPTSNSSTDTPGSSTNEPVTKVKRKRFELDFVHLDPVLSVHMRMQSMSMLGRGVLEFIHPEEREQARKDLYSSTRVNNLEGSVTRVRFARLSRIRTQLGCPPEDEDIPSDAYKFVEDDEYLIVDLSLHWACEGVILAFFHAIKDKDKETNNDPKMRHQEWSNYCGTPGFTDEDVEYMWDDVGKALSTQSLKGPAPPPDRVFLIHATEESTVRPDSVIFAWPPPRIRKQYKVDMDEKVIKLLGDDAWATNPEEDDEDELDAYGRRRSEVVPRMDGKYWAQDYAELMKHVELENKTGRPDAWGTFGKTSCTQRFQGGHILTNEGVWRKIESVFIPYGKITFACFQTVQVLPIETVQRDGIPSIVVQEGQPDGSLPWMSGPWPKPDMAAVQAVAELPHLATFASGPSPMPSHLQLGPASDPGLGSRSNPKKPMEVGFPLLSPSTSQTVKPQSSRLTPPPPPLPVLDLNGATMASTMAYGMSAPPMYAPQGYNAAATMEMTSAGNTYSVNPLSATSYTSLDGMVPPPTAQPVNVVSWSPSLMPINRSDLDPYLADMRGMKRKAYDDDDVKMENNNGYMAQPSVLSYAPDLNGLARTGPQYFGGDRPHQEVLSIAGTQVELPASDSNADTPESDRKKKPVEKEPLRPAVPPPEGIECCIQCATTESPEWRKSVSGIKNLCNACGLKLARLQAKREGRQKPRKKKPVSSSPIAIDYGSGFDTHHYPPPTPSGLGHNGQSWAGST